MAVLIGDRRLLNQYDNSEKYAFVIDSAISVSHLTAIFQLQMDTVRASVLMTTVQHTPTDTMCNTIGDLLVITYSH